MSVAFQIEENFTSVGPCATCGIIMVLPASYARKRRADHESFYCPNGHRQHFPQESEAEKLKKLLETERRWRTSSQDAHQKTRERLELEQRRSAAARGQVTKIKKRVSKGVCPCCSHTFQDLAAHMKTKHPRWRGAKEKK